MILSNVNIGTGPSAGDGDPLRSAFSTINTNFQYVVNNVNALSNSVTSVAGRSGVIILTTQDIVGINNYATTTALTTANVAMKGYVDTQITANISALVNAAPTVLDTIRELADAIGDDPHFATNIALSISTANTAMKAYVDGQITAANAGVTSANLGLKGYIDQANTIQSNQIASANIGIIGYIDQANTIQSNQIATANIGIKGYIDQGNTIQAAAISSANLGMKGYVDSLTYSNVQTLSYLTTNNYLTQTTANLSNYAWNSNSGSYSNVQVATYLPTYSGNILAGNVKSLYGYGFPSGSAKISNNPSSIVLTPDTGTDALAGVAIGGNGYLLGPNSARNITLNYGGVGGAVGIQGNTTVGTAAVSILNVNGNVLARDITAGNVSTTGIIKFGVYTVATLPSAASAGAGARAFVTDANSNVFANLAVGSGIYSIPVFSTGSNWYIG